MIRPAFPLISGFVSIALVIGAAVAVDRSQSEAYRKDEALQVQAILGGLRATLEQTLSARLHLVRGLAAFARMSPQVEPEQFAVFARELQGSQHGIRSLQLAPQGIVRFVHPMADNQAAIGRDLLAESGERQAALRSIADNRFTVIGPRQLVQGGQGLIARLPVFLPDPAAPTGWGRFWGFATILIDPDFGAANPALQGWDRRHDAKRHFSCFRC